MVPRGRIDIGWRDLAVAAVACAWPGDRAAAEARIAATWPAPDRVLACLSVRSGLDLVLRGVAFPRGSRVLVSAITIGDMVRLLEHHGLVPVPVDVEMRTLAVTPAALARAADDDGGGPVVAVLVAHLFGSRMTMDDVIAFARARELLVLEDCAQAYDGRYHGHADNDVSLFSFGTIKTSTALGGAVLRFRDCALLERVRAAGATDPVQTRGSYARRVVRDGAIKLLAYAPFYTLFMGACRARGIDHEDVIRAAVRGFAADPAAHGGADGLLRQVRRRPSYPLLALLARRLAARAADAARVGARARRGAAVLDAINIAAADRPGVAAEHHTHWVLPICTATSPDALVAQLRQHGFDATRHGSSMTVVPPPPAAPHLAAREAAAWMDRVVYLPSLPRLSPRTLRRLGRAMASAPGSPDPAPSAAETALCHNA